MTCHGCPGQLNHIPLKNYFLYFREDSPSAMPLRISSYHCDRLALRHFRIFATMEMLGICMTRSMIEASLWWCSSMMLHRPLPNGFQMVYCLPLSHLDNKPVQPTVG